MGDTLPPKKGKQREKVVLKKGFSLMNWLGLCRTNRGLNGQPNSQLRPITMDEVKQHKNGRDMWTVLHGYVYNIKPYLDYHPGGVDKLKLGAGRDCSSLFDHYHPWVNVSGLIEPLKVGWLVEEEGDTGKEEGDTGKEGEKNNEENSNKSDDKNENKSNEKKNEKLYKNKKLNDESEEKERKRSFNENDNKDIIDALSNEALEEEI